MKEKHVTINTSLSGTSIKKAEVVQHTPNLDGVPTKAMTLPRHMLSPGQDGYRTPTIEDYEMRVQPNVGISNNSSRIRLPHTPPAFLGRHSANPSSSSIAYSLLDKLQWRERIRHFTWTFFTMTMAVSDIFLDSFHPRKAPSRNTRYGFVF